MVTVVAVVAFTEQLISPFFIIMFLFPLASSQLPLVFFSIKLLHDLSMSASILKSIHSTLFLSVALCFFSGAILFRVTLWFPFLYWPSAHQRPPTHWTNTHAHSGAVLSTSHRSHKFHIGSQWWCTTPASPLCIKCKESATSISSWNNNTHLIWSRT